MGQVCPNHTIIFKIEYYFLIKPTHLANTIFAKNQLKMNRSVCQMVFLQLTVLVKVTLYEIVLIRITLGGKIQHENLVMAKVIVIYG